MEEYVDAPIKKTSRINNAIDQMYRFGEIWRAAYRHRLVKNYHAWNIDLDTMWSELSSDLLQKYSEDEIKRKEIIDQIHKFSIIIVKLEPLIVGGLVSGFNEPSKSDLLRISQQYIWLHKKEMYIRQLQNDLGKGTSWDNGDDDDID